MFKRLLPPIIIVLILSAIFHLFARAETDGRLPKARPDGVQCLSIPGGIGNYEEVTNIAGATYYGGWPVTSTLQLPSPFILSFWDADGSPKTIASLYFNGSLVESYDFKTDDNQWSSWVTVTAQVDEIRVLPPNDHKSTSVCVNFALITITTTPPSLTVTPTVSATPPSLTVTPTVSATPPSLTVTPTVSATVTPQAQITPSGGGNVPPGIPDKPTNVEDAPEPGYRQLLPVAIRH